MIPHNRTAVSDKDNRFTRDWYDYFRRLGEAFDQSYIVALLTGKQDKLVSGGNIKTINGETILGDGDLVVTGGGGVSDGDKGDITVSGGGATWTIDASSVNTTKLGGDITSAGKALLDDADAAAQRATLGLATVAATGSAADLSGNLAVARLNGGTGASGTTYWRGDGTWATPAGGSTWTSLTANLSAGAGVFDYEQTVTDAAVSGTSKIMLTLDPGADTDENQPEFLALEEMTAYPATGSFRLVMSFRELHSGPIKLFYQVN